MMIEQRAVIVRDATPTDAEAPAAVRRDAWRGAYRGLFDGLTLARRVAERPKALWRIAVTARSAVTRVIALAGRPFGYALAGAVRDRPFAPAGEIFELYLDPVDQGLSLGATLFGDVRTRLTARRRRGLIVWSLAGNASAKRFFTGLGGHGERVGRFHGESLPLRGSRGHRRAVATPPRADGRACWQGAAAVIALRRFDDTDPALACPPLVSAVLKAFDWIGGHGAIPLTPTRAFKRSFVDSGFGRHICLLTAGY